MKITVITGAGISAESGLSTFRGAGGLWEGHDIMEVASPQGWLRNPELVLDFYNQRRRQLKTVQPNLAHTILAKLESEYEIQIITQNVDDLHERAGSKNIIHLHGELCKVRSCRDENYIIEKYGDIKIGDKCPGGGQLRPHIVWFGEMVPLMEVAAEAVRSSDVVLVIGTSLQVYPAAGLALMAPTHAKIWYIDPYPSTELPSFFGDRITIIPSVATEGMKKFREWLKHPAHQKAK